MKRVAEPVCNRSPGACGPSIRGPNEIASRPGRLATMIAVQPAVRQRDERRAAEQALVDALRGGERGRAEVRQPAWVPAAGLELRSGEPRGGGERDPGGGPIEREVDVRVGGPVGARRFGSGGLDPRAHRLGVVAGRHDDDRGRVARDRLGARPGEGIGHAPHGDAGRAWLGLPT